MKRKGFVAFWLAFWLYTAYAVVMVSLAAVAAAGAVWAVRELL